MANRKAAQPASNKAEILDAVVMLAREKDISEDLTTVPEARDAILKLLREKNAAGKASRGKGAR